MTLPSLAKWPDNIRGAGRLDKQVPTKREEYTLCPKAHKSPSVNAATQVYFGQESTECRVKE